MSDYTVEAQQRILRLIVALSGNEIDGIKPAELAKLVGCKPYRITADLDNLRTAGFAEHVPHTGGWRLAPLVIQISVKHMQALDRVDQRLTEAKSRYSRS